jgi:hypothetical protein
VVIDFQKMDYQDDSDFLKSQIDSYSLISNPFNNTNVTPNRTRDVAQSGSLLHTCYAVGH